MEVKMNFVRRRLFAVLTVGSLLVGSSFAIAQTSVPGNWGHMGGLTERLGYPLSVDIQTAPFGACILTITCCPVGDAICWQILPSEVYVGVNPMVGSHCDVEPTVDNFMGPCPPWID